MAAKRQPGGARPRGGRTNSTPRSARSQPAPSALTAVVEQAVDPQSGVDAVGAALLLVDQAGNVVRTTGWERLTGSPAPDLIPAPGAADDDDLVEAVASAVEESARRDAVARRFVIVSLEKKRRYAVSAGPVGGGNGHGERSGTAAAATGGGGARTAVLVGDISGAFGISPMEGEAIRQLAHDLRTPLTSLGGAVELLQTRRLGPLNEEQERLLVIMQKGLDLMLTRIDEASAPFRRSAGIDPGRSMAS